MNLLTVLPSKLPFRDIARRVLHWWWGELRELLRELLPANLLGPADEKDTRILVQTDGRELGCYVVSMDARERIGQIPDTTASADERHTFLARLRELAPHTTGARLVLARSQVLRQLVPLPLAARENIREVLGYEMDRQTPFRADQVYYDHEIADHSPDSDEFAVELIAAPRSTVDPLLDRIAACGIALDSVEVASIQNGSPSPRSRKINLLPVARRTRHKRRLSPANTRLAGVTIALLIVALVLPIVKANWAERRLEAELAAIQADADQAVELHERLQDRIRTTAALLSLKASSPPVVEVLGELARILPDHTWLNMLELRDDVLQIRGQSAAASELIGVIEASPLFRSVSFASPVTVDERARKERFEIRAELATGGS